MCNTYVHVWFGNILAGQVDSMNMRNIVEVTCMSYEQYRPPLLLSQSVVFHQTSSLHCQ